MVNLWNRFIKSNDISANKFLTQDLITNFQKNQYNKLQMSLSAVKTMCCSEGIKATSVTGLAYFEYFYNGSVLSYFSI